MIEPDSEKIFLHISKAKQFIRNTSFTSLIYPKKIMKAGIRLKEIPRIVFMPGSEIMRSLIRATCLHNHDTKTDE